MFRVAHFPPVAWRGPCLCASLTGASSFLPLGLKSDLSVRLHGQHLAQELVLRTVRGYLELPRPDKALVLSFHGWSGTGKNFVARILAENLYRDGLRSDCVKVFIAMFHFPHPTSVDLYKVRPDSAGGLRQRGWGWNEASTARGAGLCAGKEALNQAFLARGWALEKPGCGS